MGGITGHRVRENTPQTVTFRLTHTGAAHLADVQIDAPVSTSEPHTSKGPAAQGAHRSTVPVGSAVAISSPADHEGLHIVSARSTPTLDVSRLDQLGEIEEAGADLLAELVDLFVEETEGLMGNVRRLIDNEDTAALQRMAHTLAGTCGTIGAVRMRTLAIELEATLKRGEVQPAGTLVPMLAVEFLEVRALLEQYLRTRGRGAGGEGI